MLDPGFSWYDVDFSEAGLAQGDIVFNCSVIEPSVSLGNSSQEETELTATQLEGDFVILSQSCDLEHGAVTSVVLAPLYGVGKFVAELPNLRKRANQCAEAKQISIPDGDEFEIQKAFLHLALECRSVRSEIDKIRRGEMPAYYLLNEEPSADFPFSVVDFHSIYSAPKDYLMELARQQKPRIRLISPYREHLSQAFGKYFMRVGLPGDIRAFAG
jgi:hypothetical protein